MTISEALGRVDTLKPNRYSRAEKLRWLTEVEAQAAQVLGVEAPVYRVNEEAILLLDLPYDQAYLRYLEAQISYFDGVREAYDVSMERYGRVLAAFRADHQRTHVPQRGGVFL